MGTMCRAESTYEVRCARGLRVRLKCGIWTEGKEDVSLLWRECRSLRMHCVASGEVAQGPLGNVKASDEGSGFRRLRALHSWAIR